MKNSLIISILILLFAFNIFPTAAVPKHPQVAAGKGQKESPRELFVSVSGNDSNPGTKKKPLRSVQKGIDNLSAGDTLTLLAGTWNMESPVVVSHKGNEDAWITIRGEEGAKAILDGIDVNIPYSGKYPGNNGLIQVENAAYICLQNIHVRNSRRAGINIQESRHIDVFNCTTENSLSPGIAAWQRCEHIRVIGNTVINANNMKMSWTPYKGSEAPHEAISMAGPHYFEVAWNLVYDCRKEGIDVKETASFGIVHHNYIHNCDRQGLYIDGWFGQLEDIEMYENVVHNCEAGIAVSSEEGPNTKNLRIHHNLIFNNRATGLFFSRWGADNPREDVWVYNNTFYRNGWGPNFAGDPQYWLNGGCYLYSANLMDLHIFNNIFARNFPFEIGHTSRYDEDFMQTRNIRVDNNLINDINTLAYPVYLETWLKDTVYSFTGNHAVLQDPMFVNPEEHDFRLKPGSPAINAGRRKKQHTKTGKQYPDLGAFPVSTTPEDFWWKADFPPKINPKNVSLYSEKKR